MTGGGDVIKWRPDSPTDNKYSVVMVTVAANHLKARDIKDIQDVGKTKTVIFTEGVDLTGVPDVLVGIAHNPGNELTTSRQATLCYRRHHLDPAIDRVKGRKSSWRGSEFVDPVPISCYC